MLKTVVNVLSNWAAFLAGTAITFFLSPFVVHRLGQEQYGLWALLGSVVGYLGLLDLGVRVGVTRFVAQKDTQQDLDGLNRVVVAALVMFSAAGTAAVILGLGLAAGLPHLFEVPPSLFEAGRIGVVLCGLSVAVALVSGAYGAVLAGLQRFDLLNLIDLGTEVLRAAGVVFTLRAGHGIVALATLQLAVLLLRGSLYWIASHRLRPGLGITRRLFDAEVCRELIRFSAVTTILHASGMIIFSSDAVVVAALLPVAQVAFFVIGGNLAQAALQVLGGVSRALYPLVSSRQASEGVAGARGLMRDSLRLTTIVFLPIVVTFLVRGRTFIGLWMGPEYAGRSGQVLQVLAIGLLVFASYQVVTSGMMAMALHKGLIPAYVGEAVANLALSVLLGRHLGVVGVAWGTTIPRIVLSVVFAPWYCRRHLQLGAREYLVHSFVRPFVSVAPFAVASVLLERLWVPGNLVVFFAQVALLLPLAAVGAWVAGLEPAEQALARNGLRRLRLRFGNA